MPMDDQTGKYQTFLGGEGPSGRSGAATYVTECGSQSVSFPAAPPAPVLWRTFEFRLAGSEAQEQSAPLPPRATFVVTANPVRVYLTGGEAPAGPPGAVGGIEVAAEVRG